jgi:hypothetical protein
VQHELIGQQARRLLALAEIRIALVEIPLGNPVERHQQVAGAPVGFPVLGHARPQGVDVPRVVVELGDEAQLRQPAPAAQLTVHLIVHGPGRRAAVLRKQRRHEDTLRSRGPQASQGVRHRRLSIEHAKLDREWRQHALRQRANELRTQALGQVQQWRAARRPDLAILARRAARTQGKDQPMQDRQPERARQLDDARIGQHALQEPAHVARLR